ncbi:hypothetical protein Q8G38_17110 [Halomonas venusta]|uniref:hypothetical protein n=1 Tax=Vreelandella venusta TaxID=44935 RepID=UPI00295F1822|nr:hypothetical protein [Halomonas venusta]MDW0361036.1 hypothetical protein [Halomonas venusta]
MKVLVGVVLAFVATAAAAQDKAVTFSEYSAATQAAFTHSQRCRAEITASGVGEQCTGFFEYLDRYQGVSAAFQARMANEGTGAFDGASSPTISGHEYYEERLTTNINYITEMM